MALISHERAKIGNGKVSHGNISENPKPGTPKLGNPYTPLLWWIALIVILYFAIGLSTGSVGVKNCPQESSGPEAGKANLTIQYFGNPFCVYCWIEDPIMKRLSEQHKSVLRYEHYDNRYCTNMTEAYGISAVPGFVFNLSDGRIVTHIGFLKEQYLSQVICETTGSCGGMEIPTKKNKKDDDANEPLNEPLNGPLNEPLKQGENIQGEKRP